MALSDVLRDVLKEHLLAATAASPFAAQTLSARGVVVIAEVAADASVGYVIEDNIAVIPHTARLGTVVNERVVDSVEGVGWAGCVSPIFIGEVIHGRGGKVRHVRRSEMERRVGMCEQVERTLIVHSGVGFKAEELVVATDGGVSLVWRTEEQGV